MFYDKSNDFTRITWIEYIKDNAKLCKALISESNETSFEKDIIKMAQVLELDKNKNERTDGYLQTFGYTACIGIIKKWMNDSFIKLPKEIAELIIQVLYHGILSF